VTLDEIIRNKKRFIADLNQRLGSVSHFEDSQYTYADRRLDAEILLILAREIKALKKKVKSHDELHDPARLFV